MLKTRVSVTSEYFIMVNMEPVLNIWTKIYDRWTGKYMTLKLLHVHTKTDSKISAVVSGLQQRFCSVEKRASDLQVLFRLV